MNFFIAIPPALKDGKSCLLNTLEAQQLIKSSEMIKVTQIQQVPVKSLHEQSNHFDV
jgi:hypothetical protein